MLICRWPNPMTIQVKENILIILNGLWLARTGFSIQKLNVKGTYFFVPIMQPIVLFFTLSSSRSLKSCSPSFLPRMGEWDSFWSSSMPGLGPLKESMQSSTTLSLSILHLLCMQNLPGSGRMTWEEPKLWNQAQISYNYENQTTHRWHTLSCLTAFSGSSKINLSTGPCLHSLHSCTFPMLLAKAIWNWLELGAAAAREALPYDTT